MHDWLLESTRVNPQKIALIIGEQQWTYRDLNERVEYLARTLRQRGVFAHASIAVLMPNCFEYVCLIHALARLQAVLIPLNTRLTPAEIAWQVAHTETQLLIYTAEMSDKIQDVTGTEKIYIADLWEELEQPVQYLALDRAAVATIMFTSGTSGQPKGVMLTYDNFFMGAMASAYRLGTQPDDKWLCCLPLYHVGGLSIIFRCALYGTTVVLQQGFDVPTFANLMHQHQVTLVSLVPTMLYRLIEAGIEFPKSLRLILLGGAAATPELIEKCRELNLPVATTYGLTEACSQVATMLPQDVYQYPGSVGTGLLFSQVEILNAEGEPMPLGEYGEVVVQSPTVMAGYYKNPEATAKVIREGKLYTGDVGYQDQQGHLYIVQRRTDLIVSGGENVYPADVENVLRQHPHVAEVCVVGIPDPEWGQRVAAAVILKAPLTEAELLAYSREYLAGYKQPRVIKFVDTLPHTASGKIQRAAVKALFTG